MDLTYTKPRHQFLDDSCRYLYIRADPEWRGGGGQLVKRPWKIINCCNLCSLRNTGTDPLEKRLKPHGQQTLHMYALSGMRSPILAILAHAQADLRLCWSHIPHCWKSHALAHVRFECALIDHLNLDQRYDVNDGHKQNRGIVSVMISTTFL